MGRILFLAFSGGGNLPPSLGIARVLTERGHEAVFASDPEMIPRMKPTPFRAIELTDAYAQLDRYPKDSPFAPVACYLTSPAVEAQAAAVIEAEKPDFVLADFMFFAAVHRAQRCGRPHAVMAHMAFFRVVEPFRALAEVFNGMRAGAGFNPLPSFDELLLAGERVIVTSLGAIDRAPHGAASVVHVGPALETEAHARPILLPWDAGDARPLVLVSFSTDPVQAMPDLIQRTLDALAPLDVRVVATVGRGVDANRLSCPPNALVVEAADHDRLMAQAALVITHGGHGTTMRALRRGAPMIVTPGFVPDQAPNAAMVEELGAGRLLGQNAGSEAIGALAREVLATPRYRARAKEIAMLFPEADGAVGAADEVEALLGDGAAATGAFRPSIRS